jgi:aspartate/glutamate racemase
MPPTIITYLSYAEISQSSRPTIAQFRDELKKFNCSPVIYACSLINALLKDWQGHFNFEACG